VKQRKTDEELDGEANERLARYNESVHRHPQPSNRRPGNPLVWLVFGVIVTLLILAIIASIVVANVGDPTF
jgi:hypothetical protein